MGERNFSSCPWATLGLRKSATGEEVHNAYREMALKYVCLPSL